MPIDLTIRRTIISYERLLPSDAVTVTVRIQIPELDVDVRRTIPLSDTELTKQAEARKAGTAWTEDDLATMLGAALPEGTTV
jgi:hypothetical protein